MTDQTLRDITVASRFRPPVRFESALGHTEISEIAVSGFDGVLVGIGVGSRADASRPLIIMLGGMPGEASGVAQGWALTDAAAPLLGANDLLVLDSPGTGFGRIANPSAVAAVEADAAIMAEGVVAWLDRSAVAPRSITLVGERFGGRRAVGVIERLLDVPGVRASGLILLDSILNPALDARVPGNPPASAIAFPTLAMLGWRRNPKGSLEQRRLDAEAFATNKLLPAVMRGDRIDNEERTRLREVMLALVDDLALAACIGPDLTITLPNARPALSNSAPASIAGLPMEAYVASNPMIVEHWDWWRDRGRLDFRNLDAASRLKAVMGRHQGLHVLALASAFNGGSPAYASALSLRDLPAARSTLITLATEQLRGPSIDARALAAITEFVAR